MQCNSSIQSILQRPTSPTQLLATLVDRERNIVYKCTAGKNIIVSSLQSLAAFSIEKDAHLIHIPSGENFVAELEVVGNKCLIKSLDGNILVQTTPISPQETYILENEETIQLGSIIQLQFVIKASLRQLPRNPLWGFRLMAMENLANSTNSLTSSITGSISTPLLSSYQMDAALQNTLKRVSREVQQRKTGQKDSKQPLPPMYERVGNSIAYQLLLQSHPNISQKLITAMYPLLKDLESSTEWLFSDYLESFNDSLKKKATPQCLHPSDVPTVKFLIDLCVHVSSMPPDSQHHFLPPDPTIWMNVLSIFSSSLQNQKVLVEHRCSSKVVGCMNLTSMADNTDLQCHSWEVLSNVVVAPTPVDKKPSVHIQAVTLLLSHMKRQFDHYSHCPQLMRSIFKFLTALTNTVRACAISTAPLDPDNPPTYSQSYAREIFQLLEEIEIRKTLLDLPEYVQEDDQVSAMLQTILIALAPIATAHTSTPPRKAPPKPKRNRCRTQLILNPPPIESMAPLTHRKLPEIPNKKKSKSTENLVKPELFCNVEQSLPADLVREVPINAFPDVERSLPVQLTQQSVPTQVKRPTRRVMQIEPSPSPQTLTHYNRVSFKRSSYVKAVTSSQKDGSFDKEESTDKDSPVDGSLEQTPVTDAINRHDSTLKEHNNIIAALSERKELLAGISELWKAEKGLQAASNCVLACFFNGSADIPLFIDCLECFCSNPKHWTVGVCIVLLPYMRQVISLKQEMRYVDRLFITLELIVKQFSTTILSIKSRKKSSKADMEQKQACYHELHLLATTISKMKPNAIKEIDKFNKILTPFFKPLS